MTLANTLAELQRIALIRRVKDADVTFIFHHTLTQESVYRALLNKSRREIHLSVARAYEELYPDRLDDYAALLAQHYSEARDDAKTLDYSIRAGNAAMRVYANAEAIAHFTRALQAAKQTRGAGYPGAPLQEIYIGRGRALEMSGHFQEALHNYEEMESLALQRNDRSMQLAALVALATIHSTPTSISDSIHARSLSNLALALAREIGDRQTEARVLWNLMLLSILLGDMRQAVEHAEQSLVISRELGMREQTAYTLNDLARPYMSLGQFERARAALDEALQFFRETGNRPMITDNLSRSAVIHLAFGEFDRMLETVDTARKISETIGNPWGQSFSRMFAGRAYFEQGKISSAFETMRECIRFAEEAGFLLPQVWTRVDLATLYGESGDVSRGIELAETAHTMAVDRLPNAVSRTHAALARLYLMKGDIPRAESNLKNGYANLNEDFAQRVVDQLPIAEIEIALAQKDYIRAIKTADEFYERLCKIGFRLFRADALCLKGKALLTLDRAAQAHAVLLKAKECATEIGSRWMLWQVFAALAQVARAHGDAANAEGFRTQARAGVEFIAQNTPDGLRASFLNLPSVRGVML